MKILLLIAFVSILYCDDYTKLKTYKKNNSAIEQEKKEGEFLIRFKNINTFDFSEFEKMHNVEFTFCIADGVCAFKSLSKENIHETLLQMKERKDLISVEIYSKYNMSIY